MDITNKYIESKFNNVAELLLNSRNEQGYWDGQLSSSALGVAVSVIAFHFYDSAELKNEIIRGVNWLVANANSDGGFGDTPQSKSNISTSLLSYSALKVTRNLVSNTDATIHELEGYLKKNAIDVQSSEFARNVLGFYQNDYTFSVPILATCALCGIPTEKPFQNIPQLPFELALMPRGFYRFLNLNVVSYAIPALVAVGIAIFKNKPSGFILRGIRKMMVPKVMKILDRLMPESGGFLEAIPLTAFVSLSLISSGFRDHRVVQEGINFLKRTQLFDGSWPIDIDLSNWVTALSVKSFRSKFHNYFLPDEVKKLKEHLLAVQNKSVHPFNGTSPGGWGWTHFSGSVPDGDDTPGVIISLLSMCNADDEQVANAVMAGCNWLLKLQNRDGGFPTFSRGWGKLPFDQSCADLTGHAFLAFSMCVEKLGTQISELTKKKYKRASQRALNYLIKHQKADGAWLPLWFGNQDHPKQQNPVYGTARVCAYLLDVAVFQCVDESMNIQIQQAVVNAQNYLLMVQNSDGSWGGDIHLAGTIEETSLAVSALCENKHREHVGLALNWLDRFIDQKGFKAAPIGLYFASLWYDDKLYPVVMYAEALARLKERNLNADN